MGKDYVKYHEVEMSKGWPRKIRAAQLQTTYTIGGKEYPRIPFGSEEGEWGEAADRPCHDCAVIKGQLHVPICDMEKCSVCGEQVMSCSCKQEELVIMGAK